jgi:hypothetical protein
VSEESYDDEGCDGANHDGKAKPAREATVALAELAHVN